MAEARLRDGSWPPGRIVGRCTASPTGPRIFWPPRARQPRGGRSRTASRCSRATPPWYGGSGRRGRCSAPSSPWSSWPAAWDTIRRSPASPGRDDPMGCGTLVGWLVQRVGCGGSRGVGAVRDRLRDLGLDPVPGSVLRRVRAAAHLRPSKPARRDGAELDAWTSSARWRGRRRTAGWCSRRLRARIRATFGARLGGSPSRRAEPAVGGTGLVSLAALGEDSARGAPQFRGIAPGAG